MKQVVQPVSGGPVRVVEVPRPTIDATEVLVQTMASVISPGTEGAVTSLARSSLVSKARARPDLVRQILKKATREGIASAARTVRSRLSSDLPLGYSAAGRVLEVGEAVTGIAPGMVVATAGAGKANHAEFQAVPGLLCAPIPSDVPVEDAAFATLGAIALHGIRLTEQGIGGRIVFIGLGLLGNLGARLAIAGGHSVAGIDVSQQQIELAQGAGVAAFVEEGERTTEQIMKWSGGEGADAVIITASDNSSRIISRVPELCRDRATVVVLGDVGLDIARTPFYEKELQLRFARSYGPGRYDTTYEKWAVDYPAGYVRWTEGRNLAAVLELMRSGRLTVGDLVTHRFAVADADRAYELIEKRSEPYVAIALTYPDSPAVDTAVPLRQSSATAGGGVGLIGAGNFAGSVLVPALKTAGFTRLVSVASASGLSARTLGERAGFEKAVGEPDAVIEDPDVDVVVIATPHEKHAELTTRSLNAGKNVFCEKPLAITEDQLDEVEAAWRTSGKVLFAGFNRRWSKAVRSVKEALASRTGPLVLNYRVAASPVPADHWYHDRRQGGRLIGEVCHFIDTCNAIVDSPVIGVTASGSGTDERLLAENLVVNISYEDGSLAAITYSSGAHVQTDKERLEIQGSGRTLVISDYREVVIDGKATKIHPQDKGHEAQLRAFKEAIATGDPEPTLAFLASSRATLAAAAALTTS